MLADIRQLVASRDFTARPPGKWLTVRSFGAYSACVDCVDLQTLVLYIFRSSKATLKDVRSYNLLVTSSTEIFGTHSPMLRLPRVQFPA